MGQNWMRRRWYDFRQGHSMYLIFTLSFGNFILIFHRLFVERVPALNEIFSSLWLFGFVFILAYIPVAILIGAWHRKTQLKIDMDVAMRQNPIFARMFRVLLESQLGKASQEDIESALKLLKQIEQGKGQSKVKK